MDAAGTISDEQDGHYAPSMFGQTLEVDSSETDSTFGTDNASLTTSMTSSVTDYRVENGRRYHGYQDGAYHLPNDDLEAERLDLQHEIWRITLNGALYIAPLSSSPGLVLDVGTGTGLWAIDFAEANPTSHIIGTDLSPMQPPWVPPNCEFHIDNAEQEWTFNKKFDFIHARLLCLGMRDWRRFFEQCFTHLKPGGWLELQEVDFPPRCADDSAGPDSAFLTWGKLIQQACLGVGVDTSACTSFKALLQNQGFVNVQEEPAFWPLGTWPKGKKEKKIGQYMVVNALDALQAASLALLTRHCGWSKEEVEVCLIDVRKEIRDPKNHFYSQMYIHCAQKPAEPENPGEEEQQLREDDSMSLEATEKPTEAMQMDLHEGTTNERAGNVQMEAPTEDVQMEIPAQEIQMEKSNDNMHLKRQAEDVYMEKSPKEIRMESSTERSQSERPAKDLYITAPVGEVGSEIPFEDLRKVPARDEIQRNTEALEGKPAELMEIERPVEETLLPMEDTNLTMSTREMDKAAEDIPTKSPLGQALELEQTRTSSNEVKVPEEGLPEPVAEGIMASGTTNV